MTSLPARCRSTAPSPARRPPRWPRFPGVHSAPVALRDGRLNLRILVDRSLVEVFAQGGERTIADQVYPTPGSDGLKVFATGGSATLETLDIRELRTTWGALETSTPGGVGGTVPATLALTLGAPAQFGPFTPGVARDYTATTTGSVISTAGDATLSVADPSPDHTGKLVNGAFALPQPLQAAVGTAFAPVGGSASPTTLKTWSAPTSNESVPIPFSRSIACQRRAAHRHLQQDADVHPVHDDPVKTPRLGRPRGLPNAVPD